MKALLLIAMLPLLPSVAAAQTVIPAIADPQADLAACQVHNPARLDALVCYGKTHKEEALRMLDDIETQIASAFNPNASPDQMRSEMEQQATLMANTKIAEMKVFAENHDAYDAALTGRFAIDVATPWSMKLEDAIKSDENTIYWGMLSIDEKTVIEQHGGTPDDNRDARPSDWKRSNATTDIWVYKQDGAVHKVYTFVHGKLKSALTP